MESRLKAVTVESVESFESFAETHRRKNGPTCAVCKLSPSLRESIRQWGTKERMTLVSVYLKERLGIHIGAHTLSRHFREGHEPR